MEKENNIMLNVIGSLTFKEVIRKSTMNVVKNNKLSEMFRKEANSIFNDQLHDSSSHEQIWKLYSKSVALAEANSENLALAYGNRSAILLHMNKYEDCLIDIGRALDITVNNCLAIKLLIRKAKCLHALGSDESKIALNKVESLLEKIKVEGLKKMFVNDITETKYTMKRPFEPLETFHNKKPGVVKICNKWHKADDFSSVKIQCDEKYGRHLIATKDIKPGEILYIEKPFIHCVNAENVHLHCYHCSTTAWTSIPCDFCAWTMFCSEKCKQEAWKQYHYIECSLYSCTTKNLDDDCAQLAVKALCLALKEYGGLENLKAELAEFDKCKDEHKGFAKNNKIHTSGFKTMYILSHNVTRFKMQRHKESVVLFLDSLLKCTTLFSGGLTAKNINNHMKRENVFFLSALFLRLSTVAEINKLEMWNGSYNCPNGSILKGQCCRSDCCSKGVYIAPVTSLINHSCSPNVNVCYSGDNKAIVYALQPIKKGQQILRCYQDEFFWVEKSIRKRLLNNVYNFQCECEACLNDWPSFLFDQDVSTNILLSCLPARVELQPDNERIIEAAFAGTANYNFRIIDSLGKDIEKTLKNSSMPTFSTINLMRTLSIICTQLYGITLFVPSKCNSEIKFI